jgi:predicted PhzF superfamily epimerase YddE/YHI9
MTPRRFQQVDVFTATPYLGNALAVVLDGAGLSDAQMQKFARWTNLSETTFLLPPTPEAAAAGADYQVRIFAPGYEMPFAGHPTLGSCHAWLQAGGVPHDPAQLVQQCQTGLVAIRRAAHAASPGGQRLAFAAPPLVRSTPKPEVGAALAAALGLNVRQILAAQHLCNGPRHFGFLVDDASTVLALEPDTAALARLLAQLGISGLGLAAVATDEAAPGLIGRSNREARAFGRGGGGHAAQQTLDKPTVQLRFFFSTGAQITEDPVTGSFNASMAQWLIAQGHAPSSYTAAQGSCLGVEGRVHIAQDASGQVWVGGDVVTCIDGQVML